MKSKFVQAGPVRLQYFESGPSPATPETVVLVHGYASNAPIWRYTFEGLVKSGRFRVIAFNNRGAGDSTAPNWRATTASSHSQLTCTTR